MMNVEILNRLQGIGHLASFSASKTNYLPQALSEKQSKSRHRWLIVDCRETSASWKQLFGMRINDVPELASFIVFAKEAIWNILTRVDLSATESNSILLISCFDEDCAVGNDNFLSVCPKKWKGTQLIVNTLEPPHKSEALGQHDLYLTCGLFENPSPQVRESLSMADMRKVGGISFPEKHKIDQPNSIKRTIEQNEEVVEENDSGSNKRQKLEITENEKNVTVTENVMESKDGEEYYKADENDGKDMHGKAEAELGDQGNEIALADKVKGLLIEDSEEEEDADVDDEDDSDDDSSSYYYTTSTTSSSSFSSSSFSYFSSSSFSSSSFSSCSSTSSSDDDDDDDDDSDYDDSSDDSDSDFSDGLDTDSEDDLIFKLE